MKQVLVLFALLLASSTSAMAGGYHTYRITVSNATAKHVITPPLAAVHSRGVHLFRIGQAASEGLAIQAETGDNQPLYQELSVAEGVFNVVATSTPVVYGNSLSFDIRAPRHARLSLTGMLATTNDAFAALDGVRLPKRQATYLVYAFDAGSETNNELCAYIPGPPCAPTSGNARTAQGEGFVTIHKGVHGVGDLDAVALDWRGPVASITISRVRDGDDD